MSQRKSVKKYLFSIAALLSLAAAANAQTYSGQGFAGSVKVSIVGQPVVTTSVLDTGDLPVTGGTITQTRAGVYVLPGGVLQLGDRTVSTSGAGSSSTTTSSVNSVNLSALGLTDLVTAGVVTADTSATCPGSVLAANSNVANLVVDGSPITVTGAPNQIVAVNLSGSRVLTVVINERITYPRSITANALHVTLEDPLNLTTVEVVIVSARSGINCGIAPISNLYSGRGTAVRVDQNSLLVPYLSTTIADTGWLPSPGTFPSPAITSTTAAAGVGSLLSTGTAFSSTEGGNPTGTTASSSQVEDLGINLANPVFPVGPANVLTLAADVVQSNTQCQCSLGVPTCTGDSDLVGLTANALGIPVTIPVDFAPNTELIDISVPLVASVRIVANEQSSHSAGTFGAIDVTALRVQIGALTSLLLDTDVKVARSHSDIACALAPSASAVTLSGRVTEPSGRPIRGATVSAMDAKGKIWSGTTNTFGFYSIKDLPSGEFYVVSATARGFTFSPRTVSINDSISGFDLTPDARPTGKVAPMSVTNELVSKQAAAAIPIQRSVQRVTYISGYIFESELPSKNELKILQ